MFAELVAGFNLEKKVFLGGGGESIVKIVWCKVSHKIWGCGLLHNSN